MIPAQSNTRPAELANRQDASGRRIEDAARAQLFGAGGPAGQAHEATLVAGDVVAGPGTRPVLPPSAMVGRYVLLGKLGVGGMGVVYNAYDPELDRKVAIKLVLPEADPTEAAKTWLLREAQALAKLSHPNVVAIYDVGEHAGQVWIAMELVAGQTLRSWLDDGKPRRWPELLRILIDVARGVAAAHAAGLVHRDLKPENVMISRDGRVRVMDFGLAHGRASAADEAPTPARSATTPSPQGLAPTLEADPKVQPEVAALVLRLTQSGRLQGTPGYMAPEQWAAQEATAATDQFEWSVMAWEVLYGERPFAGMTVPTLAAAVLAGQRRSPPPGRRAPGWLRRVVERGLALCPNDRWPTMAVLLDTLERARQRGRNGTAALVLVGVSLFGAGATLAVTSIDSDDATMLCSGGDARIAESWGEPQKDRIHREFAATGVSYAPSTAAYVVTGLDRWATAWRAAYYDACAATRIRGEQSEILLDARMECLSRHLLDFRALISSLTEPDRDVVQRAPPAVEDLPRLERCADASYVVAQVQPPDDPAVETEVKRLQAEIADARSDHRTGRYARGLAKSALAAEKARSLGFGPALAEVELLQGFLFDITGNFPAAERNLRAAYFNGLRYGLDEVSARASAQLISVTGVRLARVADGWEWSEHAGAMNERYGGDDLHSFLQLSRALLFEQRGEHDAALGAYEAAFTLVRQDSSAYRAAKILGNMGNVYNRLGDAENAARHHEQALQGLMQILGEDHPDVAKSWNNLGMSEDDQGHVDEARQAYLRAIAIYETANGSDSYDIATPLHNLATLDLDAKRYAAAIAGYVSAISLEERHAGPNHLGLAYPLTGLAQAEIEYGDPVSAEVHAQRALALRTGADCTPSELAFAKYTYARASLAAGTEPRVKLLALAREAEVTFASLGDGAQADLAAVRSWLVEHADEPHVEPRRR